MTKIIRGSGNVYADIGLPDAEEHLVKARLVIKVVKIMEAEGLTHSAVAKRVGVSQRELSKILKGHFRLYTVERLMFMLTKLGRDVSIRVSKRANKERIGKVTVDAV